MVSFPTKKKVGTESNSNEGRLLVSKTQSRRLTSDPAARPGAHIYVYIYIFICIDAYTHTRAHIRAIRSIHLHVWPRWTSRGTHIYIYIYRGEDRCGCMSGSCCITRIVVAVFAKLTMKTCLAARSLRANTSSNPLAAVGV